MSAATMDMDKMVAVVTLEATEDVLRACKGRVQLNQKASKVVLEGIQQFLNKQVSILVTLVTPC